LTTGASVDLDRCLIDRIRIELNDELASVQWDERPRYVNSRVVHHIPLDIAQAVNAAVTRMMRPVPIAIFLIPAVP
jgi:hypothetical protein